MKKKYFKPQIMFDSFELSESIAVQCSAISRQAPGLCAVELDKGLDLYLFYDSVTYGCTVTTPDENDKICYDVPNDTRNVFSS